MLSQAASHSTEGPLAAASNQKTSGFSKKQPPTDATPPSTSGDSAFGSRKIDSRSRTAALGALEFKASAMKLNERPHDG